VAVTAEARGRIPKTPGAPHGPDQVRTAVMAAATDLFVSQGVAGTSVKQIAARAQVNPALIRRYLGTKTELVHQVLSRLQGGIMAQLDTYATDQSLEAAPVPELVLDRYLRVVTHLVLEGEDIRDYQADFPIIRRIINIIEHRNGVPTVEARRRGAQILTLELGVHLFGPALLNAAGLPAEDRPELDQLVRRLTVSIGSGLLDPRS